MKSLFVFCFLCFSLVLSAQSFDANYTPQFLSGGRINDMTSLPTGELLIVGGFTHVNGKRRNRIALLDAQGELVDSPFNEGVGFLREPDIIKKTLDGGYIVAGQFDSYNGASFNNIIKFTAAGEVDTNFKIGTGFNDGVSGIVETESGSLYVVGYFTAYNDRSVNYIAKLSANGQLDSTFNTGNTGFNDRPPRPSIALQSDNQLLLGIGDFVTYNGEEQPMVRIDTSGHVDEIFSLDISGNPLWSILDIRPRIDGTILFQLWNSDSTLVITDGEGQIIKVFDGSNDIVGNINGISLPNEGGNIFITVAASNPVNFSSEYYIYQIPSYSNNAILSFNITDKGNGIITTTNEDYIFVSGSFTGGSNTRRLGLTRFDLIRGLEDENFQPEVGGVGRIDAIELQSDGNILAGGDFQVVDNKFNNNLARVLTDGSIDTSYCIQYPALNTSVDALAIYEDDRVLVGSWFGRELENGVVRLLPDGQVDSTFQFDMTEINSSGNVLSAIEILPSWGVGLTGRPGITSTFNTSGFLLLNEDGSVNEAFAQLYQRGRSYDATETEEGDLLIIGQSIFYADRGPYSLIKINQDRTLDQNFGPFQILEEGREASQYSFELLEDGRLLVGGKFDQINDQPVSTNLVVINPDGTIAENNQITTGLLKSDGRLSDVYVLKQLENGNIIVSGNFTSYNSISTSNTIFLDSEMNLIKSMPSSLYSMFIVDIEEDENWIYFAGTFLLDAMQPHASLARYPMVLSSTKQEQEAQILDLFQIHPTVVTSEVHIEWSDAILRNQKAELRLFDTAGKLHQTWHVETTDDSQIQLPPNILSGMYYVQVLLDGNYQTQRIIVD